MEVFDCYDLVVVPFPFTDRNTSRRRPALVLSTKEFGEDSGHIVLAMVTSAKQSSWKSDTRLEDWREAGLPQRSVVRAKFFTLDGRFVLRKLGTLTPRDRNKCHRALAGVLGFLDAGGK
jgi:mRNA interferase MazF